MAGLRTGGELSCGAKKRTIKLVPHIGCEDMFFKRALLRQGAGVGLLPAFLADVEVARGELSLVLPRWSVASGRVWLVRPSGGRPPAKVVAFERFLVEGLARRPGS